MKLFSSTLVASGLGCLILAGIVGEFSAQAAGKSPAVVPATQSPAAAQAEILGATLAGQRIVAVGDHGVILLNDPPEQGFRQTSKVPVSTLLTAVSFADASHGWAVGQLGAILATRDGGETWQLQRIDHGQDRPLFGIHFFDARHGVAVGLWSLVLCTSDGGKTWTEQTIAPPPGAKKADLNLISLFADTHQVLYATAERGQLLRSTDMGYHWEYLNTGYQGTLWAGAVLPDGSLLVGGQHGTLLHAPSISGPWQTRAIGSKSSITSISASQSEVVVAGLDGLYARSVDGGASFTLAARADGLSLTAMVRRTTSANAKAGSPVLFSRHGVVMSPPM